MVVMGHFYEKEKKHGDYFIYRDFMPEYISCQYNHLVIETGISLIEIKVKEGEPRRWKMTDSNHEHILETCIPIILWKDK